MDRSPVRRRFGVAASAIGTFLMAGPALAAPVGSSGSRANGSIPFESDRGGALHLYTI